MDAMPERTRQSLTRANGATRGEEARIKAGKGWFSCFDFFTTYTSTDGARLNPKKPMKKPGDAKSKRGNEIGDQIAFGSEIVVIAVEYFQNPTPIELIEVI